jgi:hypothetical protein
MRFFHLSPEIIEKQLHPRIPRNWMTNTGNEDNTIPRVCFAPTIDQCLIAVGGYREHFYVYEPELYGGLQIVKDTRREVLDAYLTDELWVLSPVKLKRIGEIVITSNRLFESEFYLRTRVDDLYKTFSTSWDWKSIS